MASRSLARSSPFWLGQIEDALWVWVSGSMAEVCSVYSSNAILTKTGTMGQFDFAFEDRTADHQSEAFRFFVSM